MPKQYIVCGIIVFIVSKNTVVNYLIVHQIWYYIMFDIMYNIYYTYIYSQALKIRDLYVLALFCIPVCVLLKLLTHSKIYN